MTTIEGRSNWYAIDKDTATDSEASVYIYAEIGNSFFGDSVSASEFVRDVGGLDVERINLHLNSPGGDVYDGIAIANVIKNHKAHVTVTVDGMAASAASFIAIAGDELVMSPNSELMIHNAHGLCMGNAADMIKASENLMRVNANIASMYSAKAGDDTDWVAAMEAETWFSAAEAVSAGLADRVGAKPTKAKIKNEFDLSIFAHWGRADAGPPHLRKRRATGWLSKGEYVTTAADLKAVSGTSATGDFTAVSFTNATTPSPKTSLAEPVRNPNPTTKGTGMTSDNLTSGLRERLGIPADAELDEDGLLSALDEALAEQTEPVTNQGNTLPQGIVTIEEATLNSLRLDAQLGREAREQQLSDQRIAVVNAAVQDGRIAPSRHDHWVQALAADPGAVASLDALAPGLVTNLEPKGYTGGIEQSSDDDTLYERLYGKAAV